MPDPHNIDPETPDPETPEGRKALTDAMFGPSRLLQAGEHDNLLSRFQSIWSKLSNEPVDMAPCIYIHEGERGIANAYYQMADNYYGITKELLNRATCKQVDAILYHEVGHDILEHGLEHGPKFEYMQHREFQADSIAIINGYGDELISGFQTIAHEEIMYEESAIWAQEQDR